MAAELRVVSTFTRGAWDAFARRNVESWLEHLDAEIVIYHEGHHPYNLQSPRVIWRQWDEIPNARGFVEEAATFPPACGLFAGRYDYNFDARKFSHKVYAQCDAAAEPGDLLLWLDSDVFLKRPMQTAMLEESLSGAPMGTFMRPGYHCESGVVLWDLRQIRAGEFFKGYRSIYDNRRVYCLQDGWHDCWAMEFVARQLGIQIASFTKITRDYGVPGANLHVIPESDLGHYIEHAKGARKHAA